MVDRHEHEAFRAVVREALEEAGVVHRLRLLRELERLLAAGVTNDELGALVRTRMTAERQQFWMDGPAADRPARPGGD